MKTTYLNQGSNFRTTSINWNRIANIGRISITWSERLSRIKFKSEYHSMYSPFSLIYGIFFPEKSISRDRRLCRRFNYLTSRPLSFLVPPKTTPGISSIRSSGVLSYQMIDHLFHGPVKGGLAVTAIVKVSSGKVCFRLDESIMTAVLIIIALKPRQLRLVMPPRTFR